MKQKHQQTLKSLYLQGFRQRNRTLKNVSFLVPYGGCGSKTRTYDLRVMSPTSYQLLHPAILNMPEFLSVLYIIAENMHMSIPNLYYSQKMLIIHNFTG